ncbi:MAG: altronate dehydratase [Bryobacterales bacterium]|nr:altronate dehydratase [Bryobacterales bacterium]
MPLFDIARAATAENSTIHLHPSDNIAVARVPLAAGTELASVTVRSAIPAGHKVALAPIAAGEPVLRYGQVIGRARQPISPGEHVHTHNLGFEELHQEFVFPEGELPLPEPPADVPMFQGYLREDGRAGTRNYIAVVAASNCAAHTAERIARAYEDAVLPPGVDGVVAFPHGEGCGHSIGPDTDQLHRTLAGVLLHPNVSAAVILGLGCEVNQIDHYLGPNAPKSSRLVGLTLQSSGGTRAAVEHARQEIARFIDMAAADKRTPVPASKICLGLQCGGSDSFSGITANPAVGVCSDLLAHYGGTTVLAETTESFGAEHLLVQRSRSRAVAEKYLRTVAWYKEYLVRFGGSFNDNPSPGNKEGGLTNILEKSLGAVAKAGTSPLMDVVEYAETIRTPGFVLMNTPGYDPVSLAGLAAGGCNLMVFTTGRGSATGFPSVPVVKVSSNTATFRRMPEDMDINAGAIADGEKSVQELGAEMFHLLLRTASGDYRTWSERLGHHEFVPWRIGPVL